MSNGPGSSRSGFRSTAATRCFAIAAPKSSGTGTALLERVRQPAVAVARHERLVPEGVDPGKSRSTSVKIEREVDATRPGA